MTNETNRNLKGILESVSGELTAVVYLGGDDSGDDGAELTVGKTYEVVATGTAESRGTGEEYAAIVIDVPELGGLYWSIVDASEEDNGNAKYFEAILQTNGEA